MAQESRDNRGSDSRRSGSGGRSGGGGRPRRRRPSSRNWRRGRQRCYFCTEKVKRIDYRKADALRRFLTDRGKIRPRRQTGTCARHQRELARAIKRARYLALLPFTPEHINRP